MRPLEENGLSCAKCCSAPWLLWWIEEALGPKRLPGHGLALLIGNLYVTIWP